MTTKRKLVCCPTCDGVGEVAAVPRCPVTTRGQTLRCHTNSGCTGDYCRSLGMRIGETVPPEAKRG